jgi:hypothetical protein
VSRVRISEHKGKNLIEVDLSECGPQEAIPYIREAMALIKMQTRNSVLLLTNVNDAEYDMEVVKAIKDYVISNSPYVKASAVVGIDGIKQAILATVRFLTLHEIKVHETVEEARDWLVSI